MSLDQHSRIFISGHKGMVGSATLRLMLKLGYHNLLTASSKELDLTDQVRVERFFAHEKPEIVILCAAKVGGIQANIENPATFLLDNLRIQNNVMDASLRHGVRNLVFLGSSCI